MIITVKGSDVVLKEVYSGVMLETAYGEELGICMRDTGFEFNYCGVWWEAKNGEVRRLGDA